MKFIEEVRQLSAGGTKIECPSVLKANMRKVASLGATDITWDVHINWYDELVEWCQGEGFTVEDADTSDPFKDRMLYRKINISW